MIDFFVDHDSRTPYYTQIVRQFEEALKSGRVSEGEMLPSLNALAAELNVSRETVKKAYGILLDRSLVASRQGKGCFVRNVAESKYLRVLIISDMHSIYKQMLLEAFQERLSRRGDIDVTVLLHNQDIGLLRYYLDRSLDNYDWYVVVPHFPLDAAVQAEVLRQLRRIPNKKLILLDRELPALPGNYGAVYQDFACDAYDALAAQAEAFSGKGRLNVAALPSSLYKADLERALQRFAADYGREIVLGNGVPEQILPGDVCVLLGSQHDDGLVALAQKMDELGLAVGRDAFIIGYNDIPLNALVLGGLTCLSTDFALMGRTAADMILSGTVSKVHNPFRLIRRKTF